MHPSDPDARTAAGSAGLLAAKLSTPQLPPDLVVRPRLQDRLTEGAAARATLVSAGPGWGKTMLVAGWAASLPPSLPVAWLTLDSHDNDPVLFWSYFLAAVRGTGEVEGGALGTVSAHPPMGAGVLRQISLGLAELRRPVVLVLDDFGEITNPEVLDGMADLLRHPSPLRVVLVSRTDPPLHLHRLRVDGELAEVRVADLAFSEPEADELLRRSGANLSAQLNRAVLDRTEGWAAGLRLAAMYAAGPGQGERIEEFAGHEGTVAEYLLEEVLADVGPEQRRFLLRTSVADRLCADLADALCEEPGGQRRLEDLARANAFVVELGPGHVWYRYHTLMADLLRYQLLLDEPEVVPELHRRAAEWFAAHGEPLHAVQHAVRGQHWQLVGELIVRGAGMRVVSSERQAFDALLEQIPTDVLSSTAELQVCAALRRFLGRDYDGLRTVVGRARAMLADLAVPDRDRIDSALRVMDSIIARVEGDIPGLVAASEDVLSRISAPGTATRAGAAPYEAPMLSSLGAGLLWSAREVEAEPRLRAALGAATEAGASLTLINTHGCLGLLELTRGNLSNAGTVATAALEMSQRHGCTELAQSILIFLVLAELQLERGDLRGAQTLLDTGLAAHRNDPEWAPGVALAALRVRLQVASGEHDEARAAVDRLRSDLRGRTLPALLTYRLAAAEAEVELAAGRPAAALDLLAPLLDGGSVAVEVLRVHAARAHLALQQHAEAEALASSVAETTHATPSAVGAWLVVAQSADQQRDDHRALAALGRALEIAQPDDVRSPFLTPPQPRVESMLRHRQRLSPGSDLATALLRDLDGAPRGTAVRPALVEPLTDRERVVLSHLATLQTNREIADDLFISVNTVKAHARAVYRKLEVSNRREAVRRARELDII